ncbi:MAG: cation diffusion facilitator family transporter [Lactobacillaceae bacterium]|jgi:cobalt-zinc-cadmium efflux system protein|nr:cation diffusion facilitator family transporter [Lactobacillaceae bacterium]
MTNHHHSHNSKSWSSNFIYIFTTCLNVIFVIGELIIGILIGSVSLISDAIHNLGDVLGIVIAFVGSLLSRLKPTKEHTYGLRNTSIIAAFTNALILTVTIFILIYEVIERFLKPETSLDGGVIAIVAFIGILINGITAYCFQKNADHDVNEKGVFLHFLTDTLVSVAVMIGGIAIQLTGIAIIDPIVSLIAIAAIVHAAWGLLKETWNLITNGVPENIDESKVEEFLLSFPQVGQINDLHIWGISTTEAALTAHLECNSSLRGETQVIDKISDGLRDKFQINHTTIQIDTPKSHHIEPDI